MNVLAADPDSNWSSASGKWCEKSPLIPSARTADRNKSSRASLNAVWEQQGALMGSGSPLTDTLAPTVVTGQSVLGWW